MSDRLLELVVTRTELVAKGVRRLTLAHHNDAELPGWTPGAHIDLHFASRGVDYVRQYSLCGSPADRRCWQVAVLHAPDGRGGSAHIHDSLSEGDAVHAGQPRNNFPLVDAQRYLFVAGGIGITPILPMITAASASSADWQLLYCGRSADSMAFIDEVMTFGADRVDVHTTDTHSRVDLSAVIAAANRDTVIYCCGPESMIETITNGVAADRIHVERFARRDAGIGHKGATFEVEFARSGIALTVPAERSILDMAEDAGIDIDSSCQEGVCGSCETRVLCGTPDHRDEVLTPTERAAGETMMVCVSRSITARLVLDA